MEDSAMTTDTKLRVQYKDQRAQVLVLVNHPMRASDGAAPSCIDSMVFMLNGDRVAETRLGPGVYDNPLTGIAIEHVHAGDHIDVHWTDNRGGTGSAQATVK
jgi:sulfur-oxidizing protein SoxZ